MNQDTVSILFSLLRSAICGNALSDESKACYNAEFLPQMASVAKQHDILHLLALGLKNNGLLDEASARLENEIFKAVYRYQQIHHSCTTVCAALEAAGIPFLPLKGTVLRQYYPEPWMRTSCDMDVLVKEADLDPAIACLTEHGFTFGHKDSHDVSLFASNGTHIELHYSLIEQGRANDASTILQSVWDTAILHEGSAYHYEMPDDMFYFYHIAHMAKHFESGGCGIRPFIDLWILCHRVPFDQAQRQALLERSGLAVFAQQAALLSEVWFGDAAHTEVTQKIEAYILRGGVYGTRENSVTVQQQQHGGKLKYALSRFFIPYRSLKYQFPILQKHRWLLPFVEVWRWITLVFGGKLKRAVHELHYNSSITKEEQAETAKFLQQIGLSRS